jgi:hypothetical protein
MRLSGESPQPMVRRPRAQSARDLDGRVVATSAALKAAGEVILDKRLVSKPVNRAGRAMSDPPHDADLR